MGIHTFEGQRMSFWSFLDDDGWCNFDQAPKFSSHRWNRTPYVKSDSGRMISADREI